MGFAKRSVKHRYISCSVATQFETCSAVDSTSMQRIMLVMRREMHLGLLFKCQRDSDRNSLSAGKVQFKFALPNFMKIRVAILELLHAEGQREEIFSLLVVKVNYFLRTNIFIWHLIIYFNNLLQFLWFYVLSVSLLIPYFRHGEVTGSNLATSRCKHTKYFTRLNQVY